MQNGHSTNDGLRYESVKDYYSKVLHSSKDLKTSACTAGGRPHSRLRCLMNTIPKEVMDKFYGCGAPLPLGIDRLRVLDLGSGSGRDCYLASALVGPEGQVTGVDMTREQLDVAQRHVEEYTKARGYSKPNLRFVEGHIEFLDRAGIQDGSVDLIISNCVINLSPDKERVLREAYRVLAPGGELYFSDVYSSRRITEEARKDKVLWGECISGALYLGDFKSMAKAVGFTDPRILATAPIDINDSAMRKVLGPTKFHSITARLFKLPGMLEPDCEDYGQVAVYKGTIEGYEHEYTLDQGHTFEAGRPALVCGNTAAMLGEDSVSWLSPHFQIIGDRSTHFGAFDCGSSPAVEVSQAAGEASKGGGSCC
jgi:arsenite methyltransferase